MRKGCFHGIIFFLFTAITGFAQQPVFRTFSFKEGLNTYGIFKTQQDIYGFIWIATQDGMYRFNGNSFEGLKESNVPGYSLAGNFFLDFCLSPENQIFAADFNKGVDIINPSNLGVKKLNFKTVNGNTGQLPNLWLQKVYIDKYKTLWLGANNFLAYKRHDEPNYTILNNLPGYTGNINVIFIKPLVDDLIAVGIGGYGILLFNARTLEMKKMVLKPGLADTHFNLEIKDIYLDKDTLFAISNHEIIKGVFKNSQWQYITGHSFKQFNSLVVNCLVRDQKKNFWIGTNSGLISLDIYSDKYDLYRVNISKKRWIQDNTINHLMIDRENNLWISTSKVLQMIPLAENGLRYFSGDDNKSDHMDHIFSIIPKNETELFTTGTDGLYLTNLNSGLTKKIQGSSSLGLIHYLEKVNNDFWIVSSDRGMFGYTASNSKLSQKLLLSLHPEWAPYKTNFFNASYIVGNTSYWASEEQEGLIKWNIQKHTIEQFKAGTRRSGGLPENHLHNIKADNEGFLWLLSDNTLAKFDTQIDSVVEIIKDIRKDTSNDPGFFFDMYDDRERYWFGSYGGGLNSYNKKNKTWSRITEKDGLCNNSIYGILPENDSILWVSTNRGISRINYFTKLSSNYYYEDGLQDNSFDEKGSLKVGKKLYFGGINGFTEIDIDKIKNTSSAFPVYIYKLEYYGNGKKKNINKLYWDKLSFPSGTNTIVIHMAALTYSRNHKIKFSYTLEGLQSDYIDIGDDNSFTLNALSYGNYKVLIRYRNENGTYEENTLQLNLTIFSKWYQTLLFKLLLFLISAGFIYAFYRYRIAQIKKQHKIRKNIATDLHDDLGSTLNSVKVFTNLAISGVKQEESLQQIKDNLTEATMSLRDMIWVLDDSLDTVDELITRLKQFAIPVAAASNIEACITAASDVNSRQLIKEEKRNLFLICKEAINNSVKYSDASQIDVTITASGKKIQIVVADNGKGFNADEIKKGYGLKNIQYRAGQIKYKVALASSPDKGTQIIILPS